MGDGASLRSAEPDPAPRVVVYGDFTCPWSLLAAGRADRLARLGTSVDWRAVETGERRRWIPGAAQSRLDDARAKLAAAQSMLLPGELLPSALGGPLPFTRAAVSAYAEGYAAGRGRRVRELLFSAWWGHQMDLDDPNTLRVLLSRELTDAPSPSAVVREWGAIPDSSRDPISTVAWHLVRDWRHFWREEGSPETPALYVEGEQPRFGEDAVGWLADQLPAGDPAPIPLNGAAEHRRVRLHELPSVSWMSQNGGRWLHEAHALQRPVAWVGAE